MLCYTWSVRFQIFFVNIAVISLFLAGGFMLDRTMDTKPAFIFVSVLLSFPVTVLVSVKWVKWVLAKNARKNTL